MIHAQTQHEQVTAQTVGTRGKSHLPQDQQIRIDVDKYGNGEIALLSIHNTLACDMSEYGITIRFLENLPIYHRISREVLDFVLGLKRDLTQLEKLRSAHDGAPFDRAWLQRWHGSPHIHG